MLSSTEELNAVFTNSTTGLNKEVDCVRVDGASDEGPSHDHVQYWWTEWHFRMNKVATLLTSHSSESSNLNRVEVQNGCLSLGHANTFIPSTLGGSCIDKDTGQVSEAKVNENLHLAIDAYVSRVNGCPMGDTTIKLYKGSEGRERSMAEDLEKFHKGSKKQREKLQEDKPELYAHFEKIWSKDT